MATADSPDDGVAQQGTDIDSWYDEQFDPTDSEHTDLDEVPDVADIVLADGTVKRGRSLSFLIERAMLDPETTVRPVE